MERLIVECWCHRELVEVSADEIRRGSTVSCGHRDCDERWLDLTPPEPVVGRWAR